MKILILSKRQYTNLDLIDDKFGRLRELPMALAERGHEVAGICLSYRPRAEGVYPDTGAKARVRWHSINFKRLFTFGAKNYFNTLDLTLKQRKPDLIWASSDALHIILGVYAAKRYGVPFVADLYDNYESFSTTRLTGGKRLFRHALKSADGITCVSQPLGRYIRKVTGFIGPVEIIENAVPKGIFAPLDKLACRQQLGLSSDGIYIGTAGAIYRSRGIDVLFEAVEKLSRKKPDVHLVLAGPCDKGLKFPESNRVHYLGKLPPDKVPVFLSALDVQVICNRDSTFGRYCFPQKFYETVACEVPFVAASVGAMREILKDHPGLLFEPENTASLVLSLQQQIQCPFPLPLKAETWDMRGIKLEDFFKVVLNRF